MKIKIVILLIIQLIGFVFVINGAELIYDRVPTNLLENGEKISLEIIISKPDGPGPFPTIMFNHGSSGTGANPKYIKRSYNPNSVTFFLIN